MDIFPFGNNHENYKTPMDSSFAESLNKMKRDLGGGSQTMAEP